MKTPQVPAMPGMSPLGFKEPTWRCSQCGMPTGKRASRYCPQCWPSPILNPRSVDEKTVAERQWQKGKLAPAPQQPCDVGLFSDDANQLDLIDKLRS